MKATIASALFFFCIIGTVSAASGAEITGTQWVRYEPLQSAGILQGCSLVYVTVGKDVRYKRGDYVVLNGSINIQKIKDVIGLSLKIGVKDLIKNTPFERPAFAYIQTKNGTTANSTISQFESELGYGFYVYNLTDENVMKVFLDLITNDNIQLGYNQTKGDLDILTPLNLYVASADTNEKNEIIRETSPTTLESFNECVGKVINSVISKTK